MCNLSKRLSFGISGTDKIQKYLPVVPPMYNIILPATENRNSAICCVNICANHENNVSGPTPKKIIKSRSRFLYSQVLFCHVKRYSFSIPNIYNLIILIYTPYLYHFMITAFFFFNVYPSIFVPF